MYRYMFRVPAWLLIAAISLGAYACGNKEKTPELKDLPDLNEQTRLYVTTEIPRSTPGQGRAFAPLPTSVATPRSMSSAETANGC